MKSKMPRKVHASELSSLGPAEDGADIAPPTYLTESAIFGSSGGDKDVFAVDFIGGIHNRIREASRKNVIIEEIGNYNLNLGSISTNHEGENSTMEALACSAHDQYSSIPGGDVSNNAMMQVGSEICLFYHNSITACTFLS